MADELTELSRGLTDEDPAVREQSAMGLAELESPKAAPFLVHALDDDSEMVRMWGAYGLGMLRRKEDVAVLRGLLDQEDSPLVRLWATFGLVHSGDKARAPQLAAFLDEASLDVRNNAADAILSLEDGAAVRAALEKRLAAPDERGRVWAAGILHRLSHPGAFEHWRAALSHPKSRVDAAVVAPHLEDPEAAKHLLRLLAELGADELNGVVAEAADRPLADLLSAPLLDLGLEQLFELAAEDGAARADLLTVLARSPAVEPQVLEAISRFVSEQPPEQVGEDLAQLLAEQDPNEHALLLANVAEYAPKAVLGTLEELEPEARDALLDQLVSAVEGQDEEAYLLLPLVDLIKKSPYGAKLKGLSARAPAPRAEAEEGEEGDFTGEQLPGDPFGEEPDADVDVEQAPEEEEDGLEEDPFSGFEEDVDQEDLDNAPLFEDDGSAEDLGGELIEEDDMVPLAEALVAGEKLSAEDKAKVESFLKEIEATPEEFLEQVASEGLGLEEPPPEAFDVALRALTLSGMLRRYIIEQALKTKQVPPKEAAKELASLQRWMEDEGLVELLNPSELERYLRPLGEWTDEDRVEGSWTAEALAMLSWALGKGKLPSLDQQVELGSVVAGLPLYQSTTAFVEKAQLRPPEELEPQRELWELYQWRAEQELMARDALKGELDEEAVDPDALVEDLAHEGFDAKAAERKLGRNGMIAAALRFVGKQTAVRLEEDGLIKRVAGDFPFRGKAFEQIGDDELNRIFALAEERHRALQWLTIGGPWEDPPLEDEEDLPPEEEEEPA